MAASAELSGCWRATEKGVRLAIKVYPGARRQGFGGIAPGPTGPRLKISVVEAAADGQANRAVCAALARALRVPGSAISIAMGGGGREKVIDIAGDPDALAARLAAL